MLKRTVAALLVSSLSMTVNLYPASAAIKPGSACKKAGQTSVESGKKFTCIKKSGKLIWDNGVKDSSKEQGITVDKNLLSVDVTIPASFYEGTKLNQKELDAETKKSGFGKATINSDGSVTYRMSKGEHKKAVADMKKSVDDYIRETVNDSPKIFSEVTYNKSISEFTVIVNRAAYEEDFGAAMIGFGVAMLSSFYQMFNGTDNPKTEVKIVDKSTGKTFDTQMYPEK
jgi:hypothetical protein